MGKIIFIAATLISAFGLIHYLGKRKYNKTPMFRSLWYEAWFCSVGLVAYCTGVVVPIGIVQTICTTIMYICEVWLLYFFWIYVIKFTNMEEKMQFRPLKDIVAVLCIIDNVLLVFQFWAFHAVLSGGLTLGILVILFAKIQMAPALYSRKYMIVGLVQIFTVVIKLIIMAVDASLDITMLFESLFVGFLYYFTYEYKQNDLVRQMQMQIVEDMKNPILLFDYEYIIATYNRSADKMFKLSDRHEVKVLTYDLESFIKENEFSMIKDIEQNMTFEWTKGSSQYVVDYEWLVDHKKEDKRVGILFNFRDVTAERKAAWEMEYMLIHDHLTGLYNRNYLRINESKLICEDNYPLSIALVNINGMKMINDFYGTNKGDEVIVAVGEMLQGNIRGKAVPIRLDGDEFMIIMPRTEEKEAVGYLEAINQIISKGVATEIGISVEFGVEAIEKPEDTLDNCIKLAKVTMYQKKMLSGKGVKSSIVESLKKALSESDFETEEHAERTKNMAIRLADKLKLSDKKKSELSLLAILHDIGKLSIPDAVLKKPGKLTDEEWEIMKTHTYKGYEIANTTPELAPIAKCILHHHERWDGRGYPSGLAGEDIPLLSRIITLIDSHDVMTHDRPYHKAMSAEAAREEVIRCSGTQFDPKIVEVFLEMLEEEGE